MKQLLLLLFITLTQAREIPSDNKIQGRLNIINGASAECVMHQFYQQSKWEQIEGEIGRNGIDGHYIKRKNNQIKEVLVAESKWNKAQLGKIKKKTIKQMSQAWVLNTLNKLIKKENNTTYQTIKNFITNNQYRARLFRLKPTQNNSIQISIYKIKNKGAKAIEEIAERQLDPIDINHPKNSFETNVVESFNSCRTHYLNKYLPMLTQSEVKTLLIDNYLQKKDIKQILKK